MFSKSQLAQALGPCRVTCAVPLSPKEAHYQRYLLLVRKESAQEVAVVALGRFELQHGAVACVDLQTVTCDKSTVQETANQEDGIHLAIRDSKNSFSCLVSFEQSDALATLLLEVKLLKQIAADRSTTRNVTEHWTSRLAPSLHSRPNQESARESVKASQINILLDKRRHEFVRHESINILATTWNVNGFLLSPEDDLAPWLIQAAEVDLTVMGFQELDLSAEALLRYTPERAASWETHLKHALAKFGDFQLITSKQLSGLYIVVFARSGIKEYISDVHTSSVATGPLGFANKGSVAVTLRIHESRICVLSAHLAAFEDAVDQRNTDLQHIFKKMAFLPDIRQSVEKSSLGLIPRVSSELARQLPEHSIFTADHVVLMGDLNYRVTLPNDNVRQLVTQNDFKTLLSHDQLHRVLTYGVLKGFQEAEIDWPPTYKFDKQSIEYDTSDKQRTPSYTDRILWMSALPLHPRSYRAHFEFGQSDHKPLSALFEVSVEKTDLDRKRKAQQSILEELDKAENEQRPHAVCSNSILEYPPLELDQTVTRDTTLANTGLVPVSWTCTSNNLPPWIHVEPRQGFLEPGDAASIRVTAHVQLEHASKLNSGECAMEPALLVLAVEGGPDLFLTVSTLVWQATFLTIPLSVLARLPDAVRKVDAETRKACYKEQGQATPLRELPSELRSITSFLVEHGIHEPDLFTLPAEPSLVRLARRALDEGDGLQMDALLAQSSLLSYKGVSRLLGQHPSEEDDVLDLSEQSNMLSLDEHAAVEQEHKDEEKHSRTRVVHAVAALLLQMLDDLPESVIPRSLHEEVLAADLTDLELSQAYRILAQEAASFMHICAFLKAYIQSASEGGQERQQMIERLAVVFSAVMVKPSKIGTGPVAGGSAKRRAFIRSFLQ